MDMETDSTTALEYSHVASILNRFSVLQAIQEDGMKRDLWYRLRCLSLVTGA